MVPKERSIQLRIEGLKYSLAILFKIFCIFATCYLNKEINSFLNQKNTKLTFKQQETSGGIPTLSVKNALQKKRVRFLNKLELRIKTNVRLIISAN